MSVAALEALVATLPARKSRKLTQAIEMVGKSIGAVNK